MFFNFFTCRAFAICCGWLNGSRDIEFSFCAAQHEQIKASQSRVFFLYCSVLQHFRDDLSTILRRICVRNRARTLRQTRYMINNYHILMTEPKTTRGAIFSYARPTIIGIINLAKFISIIVIGSMDLINFEIREIYNDCWWRVSLIGDSDVRVRGRALYSAKS